MSPRAASPWATNPRAWILLVAATAVPAAFGCGSSVPRGSPVLLKVYWQVDGQQLTVWSNDPDAAVSPAPVSAGPTQFNLVFDRVLDGSKVEDTVPVPGGTGGTTERPKAMPPVTVDWADMIDAVSTPPFSLQVWYNSIALTNEATNSSYVFGRELPAYPSNTTLTINLDHSGLTSEYNEPMIGPDSITVLTDVFKVALDPAPAAIVATNYWVPLHFNSRPGDEVTALPPHVHVTSNGADLGFMLVPEPLDPSLIYIQPAAGAIWQSGVQVDVTVDAGLPDTFGAPLAAPLTLSFLPCSDLTLEGGICLPAPPADASAPDAGVVDAAVADAGVADAGAPVDSTSAD